MPRMQLATSCLISKLQQPGKRQSLATEACTLVKIYGLTTHSISSSNSPRPILSGSGSSSDGFVVPTSPSFSDDFRLACHGPRFTADKWPCLHSSVMSGKSGSVKLPKRTRTSRSVRLNGASPYATSRPAAVTCRQVINARSRNSR